MYKEKNITKNKKDYPKLNANLVINNKKLYINVQCIK